VGALGATASPADEVDPLPKWPLSAKEGLRGEHRHTSGVACGAKNQAPNPNPARGEGLGYFGLAHFGTRIFAVE